MATALNVMTTSDRPASRPMIGAIVEQSRGRFRGVSPPCRTIPTGARERLLTKPWPALVPFAATFGASNAARHRLSNVDSVLTLE
jgi:hypothetical protein